MKEVVFVHENSPKWKDFEKRLSDHTVTVTDDLSRLYIQVTDDLSYANTYYPDSSTAEYLNQLALKAHQHVYRTKKERKNIFKIFWGITFPYIVYTHRRLVYITALIFFLGVAIGVLSSRYDKTFTNMIMGDEYMNVTRNNIQKNDPFAIYKSQESSGMFLMIAFNNIRVAIMCFVLGIFLILGTVYFMITNGVMLGSFHYFWFENGYFNLSLRTVFLHGTLEIFSLIIAGAAGILLGYSFLFPGTYRRMDALRRGTHDAVRMMIGIIPFFVVAALIEGFVTRHYFMPTWISLVIIIGSITFISYYFFIYPKKLNPSTHGKRIH